MSEPVVVVGAGLAGLACARCLGDHGIDALVLEAGAQLGGKVQTDLTDGFRLDRGFQVYFTAYPTASRYLHEPDLDLRFFEKGALIFDGRGFQTISDDHKLESALAGVVPARDVAKLLAWNKRVGEMTDQAIWNSADEPALDLLLGLGFSSQLINQFARPFFGGIFLDRSLSVSSQVFTHVWKMLMEGKTGITAGGMGRLSENLSKGVHVRLNARVVEVSGRSVLLDSGDRIPASGVVVATEPDVASMLTGEAIDFSYRSSTCVYFATPEPPTDRPILLLNGTGKGLVNEVVPVSVIDPETAPKNSSLVSATILGIPQVADLQLSQLVLKELEEWFPTLSLHRWRLLRVDRISRAQMEQPSGFRKLIPPIRCKQPGVYRAGEYMEFSSIEGAIRSGEKAALAVVQDQ
ncbi:MAG: FAD-dependent oxidoreductase [Armatimonadetes bacterium]|nr:FAD-dependent oxidoreductase [Armatimonadota bacterium]